LHDLVALRQEQCHTASFAAPVQPPLFDLRDDFRDRRDKGGVADLESPQQAIADDTI
jgi:hypothetical protein